MTWLRVDDGFPEHPKLIRLGGPSMRWTWLEVLAYCARHQTDGVVPAEICEVVKRANIAFLYKCVAVGLLEETATEHGVTLHVHDWETYNPSQKDPTGALRQQRFRNAHRNAPVTEEVTPRAQLRARDTVPNPKPEGSNVNESTNVVRPLDHHANGDQPDTTTDETFSPDDIDYQPKEIPW